MDINLQIQGIKSSINNMKLQIENIEIQNNNPMFQMMMNQNQVSVYDQLLNLSIQMLNSGFQLFNYVINLTMNKNKFFLPLQKISEQINSQINSFNTENMNQQVMMMQQQMMQQQMMQQQMMQQQMIQQQMMQQQMMQPPMIHNQIQMKKKVNVIFSAQGKKNTFIVNEDITIKQLLDKYMDREYGYENKEIIFVVDAKELKRNDNSKLLEHLNISIEGDASPSIFVTVVSFKNFHP